MPKGPYRYRPQTDPITGERLRRKGGSRWQKLVAEAMERDLLTANLTCYLCPKDLRGCKVEMDHIIPCKLNFGALEYEAGNVAALCFECNKSKGGKRLDAWKERSILAEVERRNRAVGMAQTPAAELLATFQNGR